MIDKSILETPEYEFLKTTPRIKGKILYLTVSGSHAYGTNNENSDLDLRGSFFVEPTKFWSLNPGINFYENRTTDTVLYSFHKWMHLLAQCNPNVIEMIGTREEDVLISSDISDYLRSHQELFLSKRAFVTFAGYATQQLRRLENALARDSYPQQEKEKHILKSLQSEMLVAQEQYHVCNLENDFKLYIDKSDREDYETEIFVDANIKHVPLREFININSSFRTMLNNYGKLNKRNHKKDMDHLLKHAMHLVRLFLTGIDILTNHRINTYREKEHELLMSIRNGEVSFEKIFEYQRKLEQQLQDARDNSTLPDQPDFDKINEFVINTMRDLYNEKIVKNVLKEL